jgi:hypothetical protein
LRAVDFENPGFLVDLKFDRVRGNDLDVARHNIRCILTTRNAVPGMGSKGRIGVGDYQHRENYSMYRSGYTGGFSPL